MVAKNIPHTLETDRLIISPTTIADADFFIQLTSSPSYIKYIRNRELDTREKAEQYIKDKMTGQMERLGYGSYVMRLKSENNKAIGNIGLFDRPGMAGVDLGFAVLDEYARQGYTYEASLKLIQLAFVNIGLDVLNAITVEYNKPSRSILQKLGFEEKGITRVPGDDEDCILYQLKRGN